MSELQLGKRVSLMHVFGDFLCCSN